MNRNPFRDEIEKIEIPANLHQRSKMGILQASHERKENKGNVKKLYKSFSGRAAAAVVIFFILIVNSSSIASTVKGYFVDILNWKGAVVNTEYRQAAKEIKIQVNKPVIESENVIIPIVIELQEASKLPYSVIEFISLNEFEIVGSSGEVLKDKQITVQAELNKDITFDIQDKEKLLSEITSEIPDKRLFEAKLIISSSFFSKNKNALLNVRSFKGHSKADAPLEIKGYWTSDISLNH